jgi:hypothetical protein
MTSKELFGMLRPILSRSQFEFDDKTFKITVSLPLKKGDIVGLEDVIMDLISDGHAIEQATPISKKIKKIRTELLKYDNDTIKTDRYDQLYVDGAEVLDKESAQAQIRQIAREEVEEALKGTTLEGINDLIDSVVRRDLLEGVVFDPRDFKVIDTPEGIKVRLIHHHHFPGPLYAGMDWPPIEEDENH